MVHLWYFLAAKLLKLMKAEILLLYRYSTERFISIKGFSLYSYLLFEKLYSEGSRSKGSEYEKAALEPIKKTLLFTIILSAKS